MRFNSTEHTNELAGILPPGQMSTELDWTRYMVVVMENRLHFTFDDVWRELFKRTCRVEASKATESQH